MIQGGDPKGDGSGGPGYTVEGEVPTDHYPVGSLAAAKTGADPAGDFGSQFFIVTGAQGATLPNDYARFGTVTNGPRRREEDRVVRAVERRRRRRPRRSRSTRSRSRPVGKTSAEHRATATTTAATTSEHHLTGYGRSMPSAPAAYRVGPSAP